MTLNFPGMTALQILMIFAMALGTTACTPPEPTYPPLVDGEGVRPAPKVTVKPLFYCHFN